jgi:hypothetical protein
LKRETVENGCDSLPTPVFIAETAFVFESGQLSPDNAVCRDCRRQLVASIGSSTGAPITAVEVATIG